MLHLGSVRTALFSWLYARRHQGRFVLRIEDTDRERSTPENVEAILDGMSWLGLDADEGPFYQSERFERYLSVADDWLESGKAYRCTCTRERLDELRESQMREGVKTRYDGRCRDLLNQPGDLPFVIRFRNPDDGAVTVEDSVRGTVTFENNELDDLIIIRSDGSPTYNFCVVIDDFDMDISHVIRGDDHLNNTPRQMNMLDALKAEAPCYAHLPMILGSDGAKLSKRHGAVDIRDYRAQGYLPGAMLNYLVRLGWSHGDQEVFSNEEMIEYFDIADVNQSASAFNPEKLAWINQQHIISTPTETLGAMLQPFLAEAGYDQSNGPAASAVADVFRERATTLVEMAQSARYCYADFDEIDAKAAKKNLRPVVLAPLLSVRDAFDALEDWSPDAIASTIETVAESHEINMGKLGQPIRVAVTGGSVSPPIDQTVWLVGKARVLQRLAVAIQYVESRIASA